MADAAEADELPVGQMGCYPLRHDMGCQRVGITAENQCRNLAVQGSREAVRRRTRIPDGAVEAIHPERILSGEEERVFLHRGGETRLIGDRVILATLDREMLPQRQRIDDVVHRAAEDAGHLVVVQGQAPARHGRATPR